MARPLRLEFAGACYHLSAQGDQQQPIFEDQDDYLVFLDLLAKEVRQQGWVLYAFCLLENQYHLLLETPEPNLIRGMRRLNGVYTQAFNRRHSRAGRVFQGRYKSILIDPGSHLLELSRYVVLNPVRTRTVASVKQWPWSSYLPTLGKMPCPDWIAAEKLLKFFHRSLPQARTAYERFVADGLKQPSPWHDLKGQMYLGSETFHSQVRKRLAGKQVRGSAPRSPEPDRPSAQAVVRAVAKAHDLKTGAVLDRTSGKAFQQAVYLLRRRSNLSLNEVADLAGVSIGRVSQIQSKLESEERDPILVRLLGDL